MQTSKKLIVKSTLAIFAAAILIGTGLWFVNRDSSPSQDLTNDEVISRARQLRNFPEDENVAVAFISDLSDEERKSYTVFENVDEGDYAVVLKDSARVLIYSPDENKLVRDDPVFQKAKTDKKNS